MTGFLEVKTFHQLWEDLGREAGVLGQRPVPVPQTCWDETLPRALDEAAAKLGPRYHAIVSIRARTSSTAGCCRWRGCCTTLALTSYASSTTPRRQSTGDDSVSGLQVLEFPLVLNCRNA